MLSVAGPEIARVTMSLTCAACARSWSVRRIAFGLAYFLSPMAAATVMKGFFNAERLGKRPVSEGTSSTGRLLLRRRVRGNVLAENVDQLR